MKNKSEIRETAQDVVESTAEVALSTTLENLPELGAEAAKIIGNQAFSTTIQALTGGVLGAVAPAALGVTLTYQQKRFERNTIKMIRCIEQKQEIIEQRLNNLESSKRQKFIDGAYRDALLDNIVSENQERKVQYNINGYINLMSVENPNDDIVFTFFSTLSQMNELDIRILKQYQPLYELKENKHEHYYDIMNDEKIDLQQYYLVLEKLNRLGMLCSKNEENRNENLDVIVKTLSEIIKQSHAKKPKDIREPRIRRISTDDSYYISNLGNQYLHFIDDPIG